MPKNKRETKDVFRHQRGKVIQNIYHNQTVENKKMHFTDWLIFVIESALKPCLSGSETCSTACLPLTFSVTVSTDGGIAGATTTNLK